MKKQKTKSVFLSSKHKHHTQTKKKESRISYLVLFLRQSLCSPGWPLTTTLLSPLPEYWDYRCEPSCLALKIHFIREQGRMCPRCAV